MAIESLKPKSPLPIWIVALGLLAPPSASARLVSMPDIRTITNDSNLIAVVDVVNTRTLRPADLINSQGKRVTGRGNETVFRVEEVLTGNPDGGSIQVEYESNSKFDSDPVTPNFLPSTRMMLFLHCVVHVCNFTKLETPGFSVTAKRSNLAPLLLQPEDVYLRVLQRLAAGLFADAYEGRRSGESPREVYLLSYEHDPYVSTLFHASLLQSTTSADVDLRGALIAALVRRGEDSMLPDLQEVLFTGDLYGHSNMRENLILALQQINWHLSLPIAAKALQLPLPELRTTTAEAIQNLRMDIPNSRPNELSEPATRVLLSALHDPNPEVAFAVMQSLGNLNARPDERPRSTHPDQQWTECMQFWEGFRGGQN
jgi:hypothetical protein